MSICRGRYWTKILIASLIDFSIQNWHFTLSYIWIILILYFYIIFYLTLTSYSWIRKTKIFVWSEITLISEIVGSLLFFIMAFVQRVFSLPFFSSYYRIILSLHNLSQFFMIKVFNFIVISILKIFLRLLNFDQVILTLHSTSRSLLSWLNEICFPGECKYQYKWETEFLVQRCLKLVCHDVCFIEDDFQS